MTRAKMLLGGLLSVALIGGGALFAQRPFEGIDPHKHANLAEAQHHIQQAYEKTGEAQKEYKEELGGHAEKAKEHLMEADKELKLAAEYVDHRK